MIKADLESMKKAGIGGAKERVAQLAEGNPFYKPDEPLLTSGLLGPVQIIAQSSIIKKTLP